MTALPGRPSDIPTRPEGWQPRSAAAYAAASAAEPSRHAPPLPRLEKPTRVGSCELYFELARGGMATVHLGLHRGAHGFEKVVAVKRLLPRFSRDPHYIAMLADEATVSSSTNHPCVRDVFDVGTADDGTPYLVMEFLVGEPLSRVCAAMRAQPELLDTRHHHRVVARVIASCCQGIHAAHELSDRQAPLQIVHRDLTPHNLFALHDGTVRVTDFGIMRARVRRQRPSGEAVLKGKVSYMSPEYLGHAPYDRRSDVWTLGVVLWEMLTGLRLFRKEKEGDTSRAVLDERVPPPSAVAPSIGGGLDAIVAGALARDAEQRYPTAREMAGDLEGYLATTGGAVGPADVSRWLQQILPESLPNLTELVAATRSGGLPWSTVEAR